MPQEGASVRPFMWVWLTYTILILLLAVSVWIPNGLHKEFDFRTLYAAGVLARTDPSHLYDLSLQKAIQQTLVKRDGLVLPFGHLADEALLFVPFSFFNYKTAYTLMMLFNALLIALCFLTARGEFSTVVPLWQPRAGLAIFAFLPTTIALAQGQDSLISLLILCCTWKLLEQNREFAAGAVLAMLLFKPHLALLLGALLAVHYGWRFVRGFAAGTAAVAACCFPFLSHGGWKGLASILMGTSLVSSADPNQQVSFGVYPWTMPNLRGLIYLMAGRALSARVLFAVVCLGSLILLVWAIFVVRKLRSRNAFAFSIVMTALLSYNLQPHDLVILLLPMVLMGRDATKALARCRDAIFGLPIALLIFTPPKPPGAGFALMSVPLLASAIFLGRGTVQASGEATGCEHEA